MRPRECFFFKVDMYKNKAIKENTVNACIRDCTVIYLLFT